MQFWVTNIASSKINEIYKAVVNKSWTKNHKLKVNDNSFKEGKVGKIKVLKSLEQMRSFYDARFMHVVHCKTLSKKGMVIHS